ncbi:MULTISPECIES: DUF2239 family protein [Nitrospirillum]|uniref:DUF2239 domain-containing protein n=2 Tax=Nitrospirillum TaxID=1543705 RepID=A0A248JSR9_9PROT|nr:DUF2239 family protein [Nitrospirillum amazonense]ASG21773.1 hypothetical protein Y958_02800 [Nitrospirillum amazonense CBAmc]MEC4590484.1 DUF2239 family protein [Nitrospirillum amazonense]TWB21038.1 hypothetical protein FBZ88_11911 [Nitrospirillum amazonense]TWB30430.1 hypothetical protein FBZ91_12280 [Nitrospirillum amazonense]
MGLDPDMRCTAFAGTRFLATGTLVEAALAARAAQDAGDDGLIFIFNEATGRAVDVDLRGPVEAVRGRLAPVFPADLTPAPARPGRPKLGVVAREVTLLPRHWEWLNSQPGGASVALRKLVDAARHANEGADRVRQAQEAAYRFMSTMAGDRTGFEEAARALFAGDRPGLEAHSQDWPTDVRVHALRLAEPAFGAS